MKKSLQEEKSNLPYPFFIWTAIFVWLSLLKLVFWPVIAVTYTLHSMSFARVSQDLAIIKTGWLSELMWLVFKGLNKKMLNKRHLIKSR